MANDIKQYLEKNDISFKVHHHKPLFKVEDSKGLDRTQHGFHTKNLFLKDERGKYYLVSMNAHNRLNTSTLKKHYGVKKLQFASSEELREKMNITPGHVSIFSILNAPSVHLVIDTDVFEAKSVGFHPNINTETLEIAHKDLEKFLALIPNTREIVECA